MSTEVDMLHMSDEDFEAAFNQEVSTPDEEIEQETVVDEPEEAIKEDEPEVIEGNSKEEEEENVLEQPGDQDSDDEGTAEVEEETEDEGSEEDEPTGEAKDEEPEAEVEVKTEEVQTTPEKLVYKANGKEFEFTQEEVVKEFGKTFAQSMNYTQKMQAIAPYKKMISAMEEEGLTQDDMNLMIDVLKGDKAATASLLKRTGVEALDLDEDVDDGYQPNSYGRNETELAIKEVVDEISSDVEYQVTHHVIEKEWDDRSRDAFVKNPQLIKELHSDVLNGVYDKVSPAALKMKVLDGARRSDLEYYVAAGQQYYAEKQQQRLSEENNARLAKEAKLEAARVQKLEQVKREEKARVNVTQKSEQRRRAAPTTSRAGKPRVTDYLNTDRMSDEEFSAFMDKQLK